MSSGRGRQCAQRRLSKAQVLTSRDGGLISAVIRGHLLAGGRPRGRSRHAGRGAAHVAAARPHPQEPTTMTPPDSRDTAWSRPKVGKAAVELAPGADARLVHKEPRPTTGRTYRNSNLEFGH